LIIGNLVGASLCLVVSLILACSSGDPSAGDPSAADPAGDSADSSTKCGTVYLSGTLNISDGPYDGPGTHYEPAKNTKMRFQFGNTTASYTTNYFGIFSFEALNAVPGRITVTASLLDPPEVVTAKLNAAACKDEGATSLSDLTTDLYVTRFSDGSPSVLTQYTDAQSLGR
jgi:hypothetical protein